MPIVSKLLLQKMVYTYSAVLEYFLSSEQLSRSIHITEVRKAQLDFGVFFFQGTPLMAVYVSLKNKWYRPTPGGITKLWLFHEVLWPSL